MAAPECPECGADMVLRTSRKGKNAGNKFWGCARFPACRSTRDTDTAPSSPKTLAPATPNEISSKFTRQRIPVPWSDRTSREGWIIEYTAIGSLPSFAREQLGMMDDTLLDALAHSTIFSRRDRNRTATDEQRVSSSLLSKFLQRGRAPLPTLGIERASLEDNDLNSLISEIPESEPEIGFEKQRNLPLSREDILSGLTERAPFSIADELRGHQHESGALFDSPLEEHFIDGWVKENLPVGAGHWFIPQVSLERLLEAHGVSEGGARRIDFLFAHPSAPPLVIEIDGGEHDDEPMVDAARDEALKGCGFAVIRIPNLELERGEGPALEKVLTHCRGAFSSPAPPSEIGAKVIAAIDDCMWASKFQMALVRAIQYGWLDQGGHWSIEITGLNQRLAVAAARDTASNRINLQRTVYHYPLQPL